MTGLLPVALAVIVIALHWAVILSVWARMDCELSGKSVDCRWHRP